MDDLKKVSEHTAARDLLGDEKFLINQKNPKIKNLIETKIASLKQIMDFFARTVNDLVDNHLPTGTIHAYAGEVAKMDSIDGWLLCNGTAIPKNFYKNLYDVIGDMYTPTDIVSLNSDKFYLPNMKGMVIIGHCNYKTPYTNNSLKEIHQSIELSKTYGEYSHKLSIDEMPSHSHNPFNHTHKHIDPYKVFNYYRSMGGHDDYSEDFDNGIEDGDIIKAYKKGKKVDDMYYSKTTPWGGYLEYVGGSRPHNNTQPSVIMNYIIKI